jgi:hypothetical protein
MPGLQPRAGPLQAISSDGDQDKEQKLLCEMPCRKNTERRNRHNAARLAWQIARYCFRDPAMTKSDNALRGWPGGLGTGLAATNAYQDTYCM